MSKKGRKTQGRRRLSYKNPIFFWTEFIGVRRGFYPFICLCVAQKTAPARKIINNGEAQR